MKPTIYRCRDCYGKLVKKGVDEDKAREQTEFTMKATPKLAQTVKCPECEKTNVEFVKA